MKGFRGVKVAAGTEVATGAIEAGGGPYGSGRGSREVNGDLIHLST